MRQFLENEGFEAGRHAAEGGEALLLMPAGPTGRGRAELLDADPARLAETLRALGSDAAVPAAREGEAIRRVVLDGDPLRRAIGACEPRLSWP